MQESLYYILYIPDGFPMRSSPICSNSKKDGFTQKNITI